MPETQDQARNLHADFHDADAVCEACSYVNPEGTIICKQCGNNLRDQRLRRIEQGIGVVSEGARPKSVRMVLGVIAAVGVVLILVTALNAERIMNSMVGYDEAELNPSSGYWLSDDAPYFDELKAAIDAAPLTEAETSAPPAQGDQGIRPGRYLIRQIPEEGESILGEALVAESEGQYYYVAVITGVGELRGIVDAESSRSRVSSIDAGFKSTESGEIVAASGFAIRNPDGSYICRGQTVNTNDLLAAVIYFIK